MLCNNYQSCYHVDPYHFLEISPTSDHFWRGDTCMRLRSICIGCRYFCFFSCNTKCPFLSSSMLVMVVKVDVLRQNRGMWKAGASHREWTQDTWLVLSQLQQLNSHLRMSCDNRQPSQSSILVVATEMPQWHAWQPPSELCWETPQLMWPTCAWWSQGWPKKSSPSGENQCCVPFHSKCHHLASCWGLVIVQLS